MPHRLINPKFPRSSKYHPAWLHATASGGAHSLWLMEWLASRLDLRPGMRVLELGCGRAASSIFLRREFGVDVTAADLWFDPAENARRIRDAGVADGVTAVRADARALPFEPGSFDAIVSIDSFMYYGTDDLFLGNIGRFLKPEGTLAIAQSGLTQELDVVPDHLKDFWSPEMWCLHSAAWWRRHWARTGLVHVEVAYTLPDGWRRWLDWQHTVAPENLTEIRAMEADRGRHLAYVRVIAKLAKDARFDAPITSVATTYVEAPLLRSPETTAGPT
jgi:cyclopropane fatty-acyl-phospholipid synthase-like methyltransferase